MGGVVLLPPPINARPLAIFELMPKPLADWVITEPDSLG